jgi:plastocyanin
MAVYFVLGTAFVVWAVAMTLLGLTNERFPPSRRVSRVMMGVSAVFLVVVLTALVSTTNKEHPREKAKAEAAKEAAKRGGKPGAPSGAPARGGAVAVDEAEYSVRLAGGDKLRRGKLTFAVSNVGKIQHDLAVEGGGVKKKTPLIDPGKSAKLTVRLRPGSYKLYCTVPGHEQLGMKAEITVE